MGYLRLWRRIPATRYSVYDVKALKAAGAGLMMACLLFLDESKGVKFGNLAYDYMRIGDPASFAEATILLDSMGSGWNEWGNVMQRLDK
ncbi:hypothetical protein HNR46_002827 [Haloferula luteola]|uniref:Uncharacterized protein n=1 Tax=Haloferula luteola TaxID=595692 RepID=A0A840VIP9_9BACT|nr:hypothetical protein [Haloferula luteola]